MAIKILCIVLVFSASVYSASASFTATADGFVTAVAETSSMYFFSVDSSASAVSCAEMQEALTTRNYGVSTTITVGRTASSSARRNAVLRFDALDDSIASVASWRNADAVIIDTMTVRLYMTTAPAASNSYTFNLYTLAPTKDFVEGASNNAVGCGVRWDSCAAQYTGSCGATKIGWTSAGGLGGLGADYDSSLGSTAYTSSSTASQYYDWAFTGTKISDDSLNGSGFLMFGSAFSGTGNARSIFNSDDAASNPPLLYVRYRIVRYKNFGGADSLLVGGSTGQFKSVATFDLSSLSASIDLDSVRLFFNNLGDYSLNNEGGAGLEVGLLLKPAKIGDNNGTGADDGEMTYYAWDKRGFTPDDSLWGVAFFASYGTSCNRSDGSGADAINPSSLSNNLISGTGAKSCLVDTSVVRTYFDGGCSQFTITVAGIGSAGDYGFYKVEAIENTGTSPMSLTIYYHEVSSYGRGRWGKLDTGEMINERID